MRVCSRRCQACLRRAPPALHVEGVPADVGRQLRELAHRGRHAPGRLCQRLVQLLVDDVHLRRLRARARVHALAWGAGAQ